MAFDITGLGAIFEFGGKLVDRLIPDPAQKLAAQQELMKMALEKELAVMANETSLIVGQLEINKIEAANSNVFVSGWRPATGWVCVIGLGYQWLLVPLVSFAYTIYTGHGLAVIPPEMDGNLLMLIGSILGVNIVTRGVEKIKGASK